jgi:perosamine synthetase
MRERKQDPIAIPLSSADIGDTERKYVEASLADGWISGIGPYVRAFERRLRPRIERSDVIATANGTLAIELGLRGLGIGPGDEVIVPALTFAAPAASVLAVGAKPVLADISPTDWTLSPDAVGAAITGRTRAIIAVDVLGHPADHDQLTSFGLPLIEDAAEAHGATYKDRPVGSFGTLSVFSFYANKPITTGEGGCVATDLAELADRMRIIANHGMRPEQPYVHEVPGRNYRMTSLAAAVGLGQLDRWDELIRRRNRVAEAYSTMLDPERFQQRPVAHWAGYSCWLHTVCVDNRDTLLEEVRRRGIDARAIWPALSTQPIFNPGGTTHPVAESVSSRALFLPTSAQMTLDQIELVVETLAAAFDGVRC